MAFSWQESAKVKRASGQAGSLVFPPEGSGLTQGIGVKRRVRLGSVCGAEAGVSTGPP